MNTDREKLPFLAGLGKIAERLAARHHDSASDLSVLILRPELIGQPTWGELWATGMAALRDNSFEIKNAKTEAEAATAGLRRQHIMEGVELAERTLLNVAVRMLAMPISIGGASARLSGFVAYGRSNLQNGIELIPCSHWEAGTMDWQTRHLTIGDLRWTGVRVVDCADLNGDQVSLVRADFDGQARKDENTPETSLQPKTVSSDALHKFLANRVSGLPPGDAGLTEKSLWEAAKNEFSGKNVSRDLIRGWISQNMPAGKKFFRGKKAEVRRSGD